MTAPHPSLSPWHRPAFPMLLGQAVVTLGLTVGLVGLVYGGPHRFWGHDLPGVGTEIAQAQTPVTDEEIRQYARSVLQMDAYRNEAYTEIKDLLLTVDVDISSVTLGCTNSDLPGVPRRVRRQVEEIMINYCNQARDIVEGNGLTAERFNEITAAHREDEALAERIRAELARQQEE